MEHRDPYSLFGIPRNATENEIRQAYLRLARLVHPDRFDPVKQPREWADANQFLKAINAAYAILTDPRRRTELDRNLQHGGAVPREPPGSGESARRSTETCPGGAATPPGHGRAHFSELPKRLQARILERQQGRTAEQAWATTERLSGNVIGAVFFAAWLPLLVLFAQDARWSSETTLWMLGITVVDGLIVGLFLDSIIKFLRGPLKPRLYVTPLHIVETEFKQVRWWPIWTIKDLKATHHYRNGVYQHTALAIAFTDSAATFQLAPQEAADALLRQLGTFDASARKAAAAADWDYFLRNDDFQGIVTSSGASRTQRPTVGLLAGLAASLAVFSVTTAWNSTRPNSSGPPPMSRQLPTPTQRDADLQAFSFEGIPDAREGRAARSEFSALPLALPRNGALNRYDSREPVAPLEIRTRGSDHHYLVKLVDYVSDSPVLTVFVRANQAVKVDVPLGSMKLRYAVGSTWYGDEFLFGPETTYAEAEARFDFALDGRQIRGYTVELFLQPDGNLRERRIRPDQW
jgi:hypothetical protein